MLPSGRRRPPTRPVEVTGGGSRTGAQETRQSVEEAERTGAPDRTALLDTRGRPRDPEAVGAHTLVCLHMCTCM